jgi:hypothetical protein
MNYPQNVTMIDDLPDLDELVGPARMGLSDFDPEMQMGGHIPGRSFSGYRGQPPPPDIPDVSRAIRDHHMPPIESGMIGAQRMRGNGYNNYGSAYDPQIGPKPHKMAHARPINLGPGSQPPALPPNNMNQRGIPAMPEYINPYPFSGHINDLDIDSVEGYEEHKNNSLENCLSISNHVENCPICRKIYKNDKTVLIIIIVILAILCILLLKKVLNL